MALMAIIPVLILFVAIALWRKWLPGRAWFLVVAFQAALLASSVVALNTGEQDEELVEKVVAEAALESHEDAAKSFTFGAAIVLLLGLTPLAFRKRESLQRIAAGTTLLGSLALLGMGVNVGHKGGELVYAHGAAQAHSTQRKAVLSEPEAKSETGEHEEDEKEADDDD